MRKINAAAAGAAIVAAAMLSGCGKPAASADNTAANPETHDSAMASPADANATVGTPVNADASTNTTP